MNIACDQCACVKDAKETSTGKAKLPGGWRRFADQVWCDSCWGKKYICRAVAFPVAKPIDATWDEFGKAVRDSFAASTSMSNFVIQKFGLNDVTRNGAEKMPAWKQPNLYRDVTERFPDCPTNSVASILHAVGGKYRKRRYETIWTCKNSFPNYQYPTPFPGKAGTFAVGIMPDGSALVSMPLVGKRRWSFILATGGARRRQYHTLKRAAGGELMMTEASLYQQRAPTNHTQATVKEKAAGGGQKTRQRIMFKLVVWVERKVGERELDGEMVVTTGADKLLSAAVKGDEQPWNYHADHVRRWIAEHAVRRQNLSDDRKAERRVPRRRGLQLQDNLERLCEKQHRRMDSFMHTLARSLADYARRRGVATVRYDDSVKSFAVSFPWAALKGIIAQKLDEYGIGFDASSASESEAVSV